ncbi:MAG TPA: hypothetical protein VEC36_04475 [Patescibacteria group bacterium]|nr:hypothetical protein [Patescibacteria group bacterium]
MGNITIQEDIAIVIDLSHPPDEKWAQLFMRMWHSTEFPGEEHTWTVDIFADKIVVKALLQELNAALKVKVRLTIDAVNRIYTRANL